MTTLECARAGAWMTGAEAAHLAEEDAVRLEAHLQVCADCRAARGRLAALAALLREPPPSEGASMERAIARALAAGASAARVAPRRTAPRAAIAAAALLAGLAGAWWWGAQDDGNARRPVATVSSGTLAAAGRPLAEHAPLPLSTPLVARQASRIRVGAAVIGLDAGTRLAVRDRGAVALSAGRARVELPPGTSLAVTTERFVARGRGSRFVVTSASVEVLAGSVQILSLADVPLATVEPGAGWPAPEVPIAAATPAAGPGPVAVVAAAPPAASGRAPSPHRPEATEPPPTLADVRAALRARDTTTARALLDRLAGVPGVSRAEVDMLRADALRLDRRFGEAVAAYHAIAAQHRGSATGEAALFTAAQLELDRLGRTGDARRTLDEYRRLHPNGRFHSEVERLRAQLDHRPEETR